MTHDKFCQLGTDKEFTSSDDCWSCDWVQRIREDEDRHCAQLVDDCARQGLGLESAQRALLREADALATRDALRGEA